MQGPVQGLALGAEGAPQRLASPLPWLHAQPFKRTRCGIEAVCGSAALAFPSWSASLVSALIVCGGSGLRLLHSVPRLQCQLGSSWA